MYFHVVQAKSEELMHEAGHMDPVQQQKLLATVSVLMLLSAGVRHFLGKLFSG